MVTGATECSYFQGKGKKKSFPNLIKKLNVQLPPARNLFLIFIYIVSFFQESQNNGAPQILLKKQLSQQSGGTGLAEKELRRGARNGRQWRQQPPGLAAPRQRAEGGPSCTNSPPALLRFAASGSSRQGFTAGVIY